MPRIVVASSGEELASTYRVARGPLRRMKGLLGGPGLRAGEALVLERAPQVHTFGLAHAIDVVFCDRDLWVLRVVRRLPRNRISAWIRGAHYAIELPSGTVARDLEGEQLSLSS